MNRYKYIYKYIGWMDGWMDRYIYIYIYMPLRGKSCHLAKLLGQEGFPILSFLFNEDAVTR
jgi:hypothetical protein